MAPFSSTGKALSVVFRARPSLGQVSGRVQSATGPLSDSNDRHQVAERSEIRRPTGWRTSRPCGRQRDSNDEGGPEGECRISPFPPLPEDACPP